MKPNIPPRGLTTAFIEALKPGAERYEVPDRRAPGLRLRVYPSGVKSFLWRCTARAKVYVIGPYTLAQQPGQVTLDDARDWLTRLKAGHVAGTIDVVHGELAAFLRRRPHLADPAEEDRRAFKSVAEEWFADDISKNRKHPEDVRAILDHDVYPVLSTRLLTEITTLDCRDVVKRTVSRGAVSHAGKVLSSLKQFYNWAQSNGFTDRNPAAPLRGRHLGVVENISDRALDEKEIPFFWHALDAAVKDDRPAVQKIRPATAAALKILLLTGVRSGELLKARWENVDLDKAEWVIPTCDQKLTKLQERRAKPFAIGLPPLAVGLFKELRKIADDLDDSPEGKRAKPFVMASPDSETGHYDGKALGHALRRLVANKRLALPGGPISPHDLRRSFRTTLSRLEIPHWIIERALNHSAGKIVETYDRHDYLPERNKALARLDAYIQRLIDPEQSNVVSLPAKGARS